MQKGGEGATPGISVEKGRCRRERHKSQAASANLFSWSLPINRRRREPHFQQLSGIEFHRQSSPGTLARSTRIQQRVVRSADGETRHQNRDVSVTYLARASQRCTLIELIAIRKGDRLQQSSAEGKAPIRLAADRGHTNPQRNTARNPQLRTMIFSTMIFRTTIFRTMILSTMNVGMMIFGWRSSALRRRRWRFRSSGARSARCRSRHSFLPLRGRYWRRGRYWCRRCWRGGRCGRWLRRHCGRGFWQRRLYNRLGFLKQRIDAAGCRAGSIEQPFRCEYHERQHARQENKRQRIVPGGHSSPLVLDGLPTQHLAGATSEIDMTNAITSLDHALHRKAKKINSYSYHPHE
jgi:hypothetical protein